MRVISTTTNPFSSQSISGFNSSPPPDDGTQSASNQVTWSKHIDKIGTPLKTLAEAINSAAVTLGSKTVNTSADVGSQIDGSLAFNWATATIASEIVVPSSSALAIGTEGGATADTLQVLSATATAIYSGALLLIKQRHATEEINVIHATSTAATATGANIFLADQANSYSLDATRKTLTLQYDNQVATSTGWYEIARTPVGGGKIIQYAATDTLVVTTCGTNIPLDNTVPLDSEGDQIFSFAFTPIAAGNTLLVEVDIMGSTTTTAIGTVALFASATTAIAADFLGGDISAGSGGPQAAFLRYATTATGTSAKTFKVRVGATSNSFLVNGYGTATGPFAQRSRTSLTVWEIAA